MQQPDRLTAPEFRQVGHIDILRPETIQLDNGIPVHLLNAGTQELVKIEWIFDAGMKRQSSPLVSAAVNDMLDEGTVSRSAVTIAEELDYYGAFIESEVTHDRASFTLFTLNKHLASTLPVVADILQHAAFPEKEFGIYLSNKRQKFLVESGKVSTMARRNFLPLIFGDTHPYGAKAELRDFEGLNREQAESFFRAHYHTDATAVIVSGRIEPSLRDLLNQYFGQVKTNTAVSKNAAPEIVSRNGKHTVEKADAIQSAIRMGRLLFNRAHPDFIGMQVLNTVLGGYFGSRLMANIREDKGYTYGIGSAVVSMEDAGYFVISTEVGVDVTTKALDEIYLELRRLRDDLIPESELELVRNYMIGTFLRSTDGAFALSDRFKALYGYPNLDYSYYDRYLEQVKSISSQRLRDLAQQYLAEDSLTELVAGKRG